jgi:hypothetical protein
MRPGALRLGSAGLVLALGLAPALAWGQDLAGARAFVTGLYRAYDRDGQPDYLGPIRRRVFSPGLLRLMREDDARTPKGEVGALDGDPICDCQDSGGFGGLSVAVTAAGPDRAKVVARFSLDGEKRVVTLDLVIIAGHWRVADTHSPGEPGLRALLHGGR